MFSFDIPDWQIQTSGKPVAMFYFPTKRIKFYNIKPRGSYFAIYTRELKGIFKIDADYVWYIGKTPVYHYSVQNIKPFNPTMVDKLNKFMKINGLARLKQKDVKHGAKLQSFVSRFGDKKKAMEKMDAELATMVGEMEGRLQDGRQLLQEKYDKYNQEHETDYQPTEEQESFYIVDYLKGKGLLDEAEHGNFVYKISNGILTFEELVEELRQSEILRINEPLDVDVQDFIEDFTAQEPLALSNHMDDFVKIPKGLKAMTSVPVKNWIPGGTIIGIFIGIAVLISLAASGTFNDLFQQFGSGDIKFPGFGGG